VNRTEPPRQQPSGGRAPLLIGVGLWSVALLAVGFPLAMHRHFQVDEFHNLYNASLLFRWATLEAAVHPEVFQVALGYLTRHLSHASDVLLTFRAVFFLFFALNLLLLGWAQPYFGSWHQRLLALLGASLLVPLWEYGFEIRHDVLFLTGMLVLFMLLQRAVTRQAMTRWLAVGAGATLLWLFISAHKAPAYLLPLGGLLLWVGSDLYAGSSRWRRLLAVSGWTAAGFVAAAALVTLLLWATGTLRVVVAGIAHFVGHLEGIPRESPQLSLASFFRPHPALMLLIPAHVILAVRGVMAAGRKGWRPSSITLVFLLVSTAVLFANPRPFPYNLLHFAPFVYLAALDVAAHLKGNSRVTAALALLVLTGALGMGWALQTRPYLRFPNSFQLGYIRAAEEMTAAGEPVLDGVGMVVTRPPVDRFWMLHSSFMHSYRAGLRTPIEEIVARAAPPVVLVNYRLGWIHGEDMAALRRHYVELEPSFLVLGGALPEGETTFEIARRGSYVVHVGAPMTIAGRPVADGQVIELDRGAHAVAGLTEEGLFRWAGPSGGSLAEIPTKPREVPLFLPFPAR
jgi:hypothetical protein